MPTLKLGVGEKKKSDACCKLIHVNQIHIWSAGTVIYRLLFLCYEAKT